MNLRPDPEAYRLFHEGSQMLSRMEAFGCRIDVAYLEKAIGKIGRRIERLTRELKESPEFKEWRKRFGAKTQLGSRQQLGELVYGVLKHPCETFTPSGRPATDEDALEKIDLPFVRNYLEVEKLKKARTTYLDGIKNELVGDRIHPNFNLHTVATYRSSASNPNVQNQPNRNPKLAEIVRRCFIPSKSRVLVEVDMVGAEVRVGACYHKDPRMIDYINDSSKDMHRDAAMRCYLIDDWNSVPEESEINPKNRKAVRYQGKNGWVFPAFYGSVYFQCAPAMWDAAKGLAGPGGVPMREHLKSKGIKKLGDCDPKADLLPGTFVRHVKEYQDYFWGRQFAGYSAWKERWYADYRKIGAYKTLTGFVIQGLYKKNEVLNGAIQGSAFHCELWGLNRIDAELRKRRMKTRAIMEIHDSGVFDAPESEVQDLLHLCRRVMTEDLPKAWPWIIVPIAIEAEVAEENWASKREWVDKNGTWAAK